MTNIAKKISWLTPLALFVSLPANAIHISITETIDNPGFEINQDETGLEIEGDVATEFEVVETWDSVKNPYAHKLITIDYQGGDFPPENSGNFEFEFLVTNNTRVDWSSYSFTFSGLGDLALSDVLVDWENEIGDGDAEAFSSTRFVGDDTFLFYNGSHSHIDDASTELVENMVSYELFFNLDTLEHAGITELATVQAVPLPAAAWLMIGGLGMLVGFAKKRKTA